MLGVVVPGLREELGRRKLQLPAARARSSVWLSWQERGRGLHLPGTRVRDHLALLEVQDSGMASE